MSQLTIVPLPIKIAIGLKNLNIQGFKITLDFSPPTPNLFHNYSVIPNTIGYEAYRQALALVSNWCNEVYVKHYHLDVEKWDIVHYDLRRMRIYHSFWTIGMSSTTIIEDDIHFTKENIGELNVN